MQISELLAFNSNRHPLVCLSSFDHSNLLSGRDKVWSLFNV
jgi:hypothetical protein